MVNINKNMLKIQISPEKKVEDAMVVWHEQLPDVDLVIDSRYGLHFKPGSIKVIYIFNLLGITPLEKIPTLLKNLVNLLEIGGELYIIEQDFDYICRAFLGGDLSVRELNQDYNRTTFLNQEEIVSFLERAGFPVKEQVWWQESPSFIKKNSEIIISGVKNKNQQYG